MPYKDPHDPRKIVIDCAYLNTERGFVTQMISGKFKPSYGKKTGHIPAPNIDKMEVWRLYMNHLIKMKEKFPMLHISLNGGITSLQSASDLLDSEFDGVMIGRSAYTTPWDILSNVDEYIFGDTPRVGTRLDIILNMQPYIKKHLATGGKVNQVTRHMIGLFNGQENSKKWRRFLSDEANLPGANESILLDAYETMVSNIECERKVYVS